MGPYPIHHKTQSSFQWRLQILKIWRQGESFEEQTLPGLPNTPQKNHKYFYPNKISLNFRERNHCQMKSRTSSSSSDSIRAAGQRSIPSTFLFRPIPKCSSISKGGSDAPSSQGSSGVRSHLSLSAFLDRKLHSTSVLPTHKQVEKEELSLPLESKTPSGSILFREDQEGKTPAIEDSVFKLFNDKGGGKVGEACPEGITDHPTTDQATPEGDVKKNGKNHVLVLGDDPKPKKRGLAGVSSSSSKRPRPFFNHYKTGTGWWDSGREGIDEDEVGATEIWEGIGSTTIGGLEWH